MIVRRFALAPALAAAAFALAGCGMMGSTSSSSSTPMAQPMMGNAMSATLSAASEVPANSSSGSGSGSVKLDGNTLSWTVTYSGLSGPVTGAHFHGPAAAGANAGVVVPFAGSLASPISGTRQLTAAQTAELKAGLWYINLHTAANPGGEIRGQVR
ncbi:MAG: CHRD domain-containing protein [Caldimonas sp.]